jgi:hypothetical protein
MVLLTVLLAAAGCSNPATGSTDDEGGIEAPPPVTRTFHAQRVTDNSWYDVSASRLGYSDSAEVYVEDGQPVSAATAQAIADEFDDSIYEMVRTRFGPETDVDDNGRVILLLLDIQDGFSGSGGYVAGYFHSVHMYDESTFSNSNEAEMLFLDTYPADAGTTGFYTTVAHEMQHLVNWVNNPTQDIWINEGLSSAAEYLYEGAHQQDRISYYKFAGDISLRYGNNFFVWYGAWEASGFSLANYATVYLFFQWLRIHASNDAGIYQAIFSSPHSDFQAVVDAAATYIDPSLSTWEEVLSHWLRANFLHQASGLYSYNNEINIDVPWWTAADATWPLSPGEAIYVQPSEPFVDDGSSDSDIRFNGFSIATQTVDDNDDGDDAYGRDAILVYNSNSSTLASDATAIIPAIITPSPESRLASQQVSSPEIYPIDVVIPVDGVPEWSAGNGQSPKPPVSSTAKPGSGSF